MVYKGGIDITAAPPAAQSGWTYAATTGGTPNAGFTGLSGTLTAGTQVTFDGTKWQQSGGSGPWTRTGTALSPVNAGDVVNISAGTAALPGLTPVGDVNTGLFFPAADTIAVAEGGSERLRLVANGRLLVGTSSELFTKNLSANGNASGLLQVVAKSTSNANTLLATFQSLGLGHQLSFVTSRGSTVGTPVQADDTLGRIAFFGDNGTDITSSGASILCSVDGTPGANDMPGRLVFSTTASGAAAPIERLRIKSSGIVNITGITVYADNTAALAGGLVAGDNYRKADGTLMITF